MRKLWKTFILLGGLLCGSGLAQAEETGSTDPCTTAPWSTAGSCAGWQAEQTCSHEPGCFWLQGEYLLWFINKSPSNTPLVTSSTTPDINLSNGTLGQPGTTVLFSDDNISHHGFSGFRVRGGTAADCTIPMECSFFWIEQGNTQFSASSDPTGTPVLGRPAFAAQNAVSAETVYLSSFPGLAVGNITVASSTRLFGGDASVVQRVWTGPHLRLDLSGGFSYLELHDDLTITSSNTPISTDFTAFYANSPFSVGGTTIVTDQFNTRNRFYGGQIGARAVFDFSQTFTSLFVELRGKLNIGATEGTAHVNGFSTLLQPGAGPTILQGGILAVPSNIGRFSEQRFAVIPEGSISIGHDITSWLRVSVGYDFLYWSRVTRPTNLLNRSVDTQQVVTDGNYNPSGASNQPPFVFHDRSFWAQGVSFGLSISY
jgi:hypothetical protein